MFGALCLRPKPWVLPSLSFLHGPTSHHHRLVRSPTHFLGSYDDQKRRRHHSSACRLVNSAGGAASIWHAILPSSGDVGRRRGDLRLAIHPELKGEGSWNAAWDARPARWLHRPDSAWLLFGVCACLSPLDWSDVNPDVPVADEKIDGSDASGSVDEKCRQRPLNYRITGVLADGRCLFRAIAHGACLRNGEEAPDESRQRELADELRAQVVQELLKRREETEWFIEGNFDTYVKRIQQPYVWGGEPELLMASHILKAKISVFMIDRGSNGLINIANYGEEYRKGEESPINVLFHGYGHYDLVEIYQSSPHKVEA